MTTQQKRNPEKLMFLLFPAITLGAFYTGVLLVTAGKEPLESILRGLMGMVGLA